MREFGKYRKEEVGEKELEIKKVRQNEGWQRLSKRLSCININKK